VTSSVVTLCNKSEQALRFGRTYRFHLRGHTESQDSVEFLSGLLFDPEDGGNVYLRNIRLSANHTAFYRQKNAAVFYVEDK
jgi:hypothetical protein